MNIKEYNKKKSNMTVNRKMQQNAQINIPGDNVSDSSKDSKRDSRIENNKDIRNQYPKRKKIRFDKIIGYITIITIVIFVAIIYSDIKGTTKASNAQEILAVNGSETSNSSDNATSATKDPVLKKNGKIVCIDPGHGGTDGGAQYNGYSEKVQTLEISKLVQKELEAQGVTVIMTRTSDTTVSLEKRLEIAKTADAGVFVSIHRNYYDTSSSVNGVEAWVHSTGPADAKSLANSVLTQLKKITGVNNRGVKTGTMTNINTDYYLNSNSTCTSCIIELGFMTNTADNALVTTNKNQCAKSIAQGIINYMNELEK